VTGLADGTVYYFVVKAYNTAGLMSGYSSEVSGRSGYSSEVSGQSGYSSEVSGQTSGGEPPVDYTNTPAAPAGVIGADFNGDSQPDLIWQNASWQAVVWYMGGSQGAVFQGWTWLSQAGVPGWSVVGAGDFNGDGKPDLVWQNDGTWEVVVWYMGGAQGNSFLGWNRLASDVAGWSVVGAGDFNGDGKPDLVWQNDRTWEVVVWYMGGPQGNSPLGKNGLASTNVAGWSVVGARDFNGDSKPDLVWQNDGTWEVVVWYMGGPQGNSLLGWNTLASRDVAGWRAIAR
jgi:hypothetical protein